jgi:pentose-5-phosphate-3-epimerase
MPAAWRLRTRAILAFPVGLLISFALNASLNFEVPRQYLRGTFVRFACVSALSFVCNLSLVGLFQNTFGWSYGPLRIVCSGLLFALAYAAHRRLTFKSARNFGIAVYASQAERVYRIFHKVGRACDHIHVDIVDTTMNAQAAAVDLRRIEVAKRLWPNVPFALHIMSRRPRRWVEPTLAWIDWYLFHLSADDNLFELLADCQRQGKRVGIVWHQTDRLEALYPYLPHVDFVMVLGIAQPGRSGQPISEEAIDVTTLLERLRPRYGYELMFDGSVNQQTIDRIQAKYVVAASAVLNAANPVRMIYGLKTGTKDERWAA